MSRDGLPLSLDAIAGFGDAIVREARHAQAIASLDGSPVPALLEAVHALQAVLLSANPGALRARAGWIGRLLGRDLVLEAEGRVFRERLRVLVHDADAKLAAFARFDDGIAAPDTQIEDAARRRIREELGLHVGPLTPLVPDFRYRAVDASGIVENEICPVHTARAVGLPRPNPDEVMDHAWVEPDALRRAIDAAPWAFSPWLVSSAVDLPHLQGGVP